MKKIIAYALVGLGISTIVSCGSATRSWNAYTSAVNYHSYAGLQSVSAEEAMLFQQACEEYRQSLAAAQAASYYDSECESSGIAYDSSSDPDYDLDKCGVCRGEGKIYHNFEKYSCSSCSGSGFRKTYPPSFDCTFLIRH